MDGGWFWMGTCQDYTSGEVKVQVTGMLGGKISSLQTELEPSLEIARKCLRKVMKYESGSY